MITTSLVQTLLAVCLSCTTSVAQERRLEFSVDPRIELLAAVQMLSAYNERYGLLTRYDFEYKRAMTDQFLPYAHHPAVALFDTMSTHGFAFDAPPTLMLHLSEPPALDVETEIPEALIERAGGAQQLTEFLARLRDFARESGFMRFYASQTPVIAEIVRRSERQAEGGDYIETLERYYGMRQHGYHIVLAPLFHQGGYGPKIQLSDGSYDLYNITGPKGVVDGYPTFGSAEDLRHLALHEFGHSFVNPTTERFSELVAGYEALYEPIREKMTAMAYPQWEVAVNEHIIRAVTTRMVYLREGRPEGDRVMQIEKGRGFIYVPALMARLEIYEAERDRYPDFIAFYPRLVEAFDSLSNLDIAAEFGLDRFGGTINAVTEIESSVVLIIPTAEADADAQLKIHDYVRRVKEALYPSTPILTDAEALERDLSGNAIVAYGTMNGNLWLAAHADRLPMRIEADRIVADSAYRGTDLRLIAAWPNPYNPARGMLIYTAQRAADVVGINGVFHGPTDYVIARGQERLREGYYAKDGDWRF